MTGHTEVVRVIYDPAKVSYEDLLKVFWESHDPTQGCVRATTSARNTARDLCCRFGQREAAEESKRGYQSRLGTAGRGAITTEMKDLPEFFYAEDYHQQYLAKNRGGYCRTIPVASPIRRAAARTRLHPVD